MRSTRIMSRIIASLAGVMMVILVSTVLGQTPQSIPNRGLAAVDRAAKANRYLFIFFYRQDDQQTRRLGDVFSTATSAMANRADSIAISITDPAEAAIVNQLGVSKAPMPLVLALAPSGAVTGSFPGQFTREQLLDCFASPCMEKLLRTLQQGKLVVLCIQNGGTRLNAEAMNGVRELKADPRYGAATEILMLDPGLPVERPFLAKLGMTSAVEEATTLFVAPPGSIVGTFRGATDKNQLVAALTKAAAACCPAGSQPGCCPVAK